MKNRLLSLGLLGLGVFSVAIAGKLALDRHKLQVYRLYIESAYKPQLSLIEREMKTQRRYGDDTYFELLERLRKALSPPEIFGATWSSDGHHGMETLKQWPDGVHELSQVGFVSSTRRDEEYSFYEGSDSLYPFRADNGTRLLRYEGRIKSGRKRVYWVYFSKSKLDQEMKSK